MNTLEQRIERLELAAVDAGWDIEPRSGERVLLTWRSRGQRHASSLTLEFEEVNSEDGYRWSTAEAQATFGEAQIKVIAWRESLGKSEPSFTLLLENRFENAGCAYFEDLEVSFPGKPTIRHEGRHVIIPRGYLPIRLRPADYWRHFVIPQEGPAFAESLCASSLSKASQHERILGPYTVADPVVKGTGSLNGSHAGWKIAPHRGGRDSWTGGCASGMALAERWMLGTICRSPIALHTVIETPYWLGRTIEHEPAGYKDQPDSWCPYAQELYDYRPHDYTHMWRQVGDAAQMARVDQLGRYFLRASWFDCEQWMYNPVGDEDEDNDLFWTIKKLTDTAVPGVGHHQAGRGLAHIVRCLYEAAPWLEPARAEVCRQDLAAFAAKVVVPQTGVCHASLGPDVYNLLMEPPISRAREVDLLGVSLPWLGLRGEHEALKRFMQKDRRGWSVAGAFEIRPGMRHWTSGVHSSPSYFVGYDALRGDISHYGGSVESLMEAASYNDVRENPLDWTDPEVWR